MGTFEFIVHQGRCPQLTRKVHLPNKVLNFVKLRRYLPIYNIYFDLFLVLTVQGPLLHVFVVVHCCINPNSKILLDFDLKLTFQKLEN